MIEFHPHPTDPNLVVLKTTPRYIGKHSDEDLQAAVLAEREACAKLCESTYSYILGVESWFKTIATAIRARGNK